MKRYVLVLFILYILPTVCLGKNNCKQYNLNISEDIECYLYLYEDSDYYIEISNRLTNNIIVVY